MDKSGTRVSSATAGRPAPAPAHTERGQNTPEGGAAGPGRAARAPRSATRQRGGARPSAGSGTATKWRPPLTAAPLRPRAPRPPGRSPTARLSPGRTQRRSAPAVPPLALLRDAEEPAHLKWRTPRLTPPGPSSPHRNRASPAVLTAAGQRGIAGRAPLRRTSAPPRALTPRTFRRGSP